MARKKVAAGRPLKNFEDYLEILMRYCKGSGIKVIYKEIDCEACYLHDTRTLTVCKDLAESTEIAVILHEVGHSLDEVLTGDTLRTFVNAAYPVFYKNKATKKQKKLVLDCEKRAWKLGRAIAKKLRIPLGKWYDNEEKDALDTYRHW